MTLESKFHRDWLRQKRPFFVDSQKTTYEAFIDAIEYDEAYPENEELAIRVIDMLKKKYSLIF